MESFRRGATGKRLFTPELKREQVTRVLRGDVTVAELSRELQIAPALIRRWKHRQETGGQTAVGANEDVVPASELRAAQQRIRELERALGRQVMEVEILQVAQAEIQKRPSYDGVSTP